MSGFDLLLRQDSSRIESPQALYMPQTPTGWAAQGMKKLLHPQVVKIIAEIRPPSPCRLPSDFKQPRSGIIRTKERTAQPGHYNSAYTRGVEKNITLQLNTNSLLLKRNRRKRTE